MFLRLRWFTLGMAATVWSSLYVLTKLRRVTGGFTAAGIRRAAIWAAADLLDLAGRALGAAAPRPGRAED